MDSRVTASLELVRRAQGGDRAALDRLLERYADRVRRMVRMRLGARLRSSVESADILQETLLAAVRAFDRFEMRDEASLVNWLARLAERQVIAAADYHGAQKRDADRNVPLAAPRSDDTVPVGRDPAADQTRPLERLERNEERERLEACIAELPEEYRELVLLRDYAGYSWEAVAEETGRPTAAAARMMHARALVELGKRLREGEGA